MDFAERICTGAGIFIRGWGWSCGVCVSGDFLERVYPLVYDGCRCGLCGTAVLDPGISGRYAAVNAVSVGNCGDHDGGILYRMCCEPPVGTGCLGLFGDARKSDGADLSDIFRYVVFALHTGVLAVRTDPGKTERRVRCKK